MGNNMTVNITTHIKEVFYGIGEFVSIKLVPSYLLPVFGYLIGFENFFILKALVVIIIFDFITGIFAAYKTEEVIKSKKAIRSAYKLAVYGLLVSAGHLTDIIVFNTNFIETAMSTFLVLTELISIIENADKMGYAVPQKLLNQLHRWRDEEAPDRRVEPETRREEIVIPKQ